MCRACGWQHRLAFQTTELLLAVAEHYWTSSAHLDGKDEKQDQRQHGAQLHSVVM